MSFSLVAVVLLIVSSLSMALLTDMGEGINKAEMTIEELDEMNMLLEEGKGMLEDMAFQAIVSACGLESVDEADICLKFSSKLAEMANNSFPLHNGGYTLLVNISEVCPSFLRLSLSDDECYSSSLTPAYVGVTGEFEVKVSSTECNITKRFQMPNRPLVPWPLLLYRMNGFERAATDGMGELSSMIEHMLSTLATYRALQGWGSATMAAGKGVDGMITESDVKNAIGLGLIMMQYQWFRNVTPCYDLVTEIMDGEGSWNIIKNALKAGGDTDPADILLSIYGYDHFNWRTLFAQAIYASEDRSALRWLEWLGLIDLINGCERFVEKVCNTANDVIELFTDKDIASDQFKEWIIEKFDEAGYADTIYRYFGKAGPEDVIDTPREVLTLFDRDGRPFLATMHGFVNLDIPEIDVLSWGGWGDFNVQYKESTNEILDSMRGRLERTAYSLSMNMAVPTTELKLDPQDGVSLLDEIQNVFDIAVANKDEWICRALNDAISLTDTTDPLVEATKQEFKINRDEILCREDALRSLAASCAEQLMARVVEENPGMDLPWDDNVCWIESYILTNEQWGMLKAIDNVFERQASFIEENFVTGISFTPIISGCPDPLLSEVIVRSGDTLAGLGDLFVGDVTSLIDEVANAANISGSQTEVQLPMDQYFTLIDSAGTIYRENMSVGLSYPFSSSVCSGMTVEVTDPSVYREVDDLYPQLHDTDLLRGKWASFQSVWDIVYDGQLDVSLAPGGEVQVIPVQLGREMNVSSELTIAVMTGHPLLGVTYQNINTLTQQLTEAVEDILRPLLGGIGTIVNGLRGLYRLMVDAVHGIMDAGSKALGIVSNVLQCLLETLQEFIRSSMQGLLASSITGAADLLGERRFNLIFLGIAVTIVTHPKDLLLDGKGVPVSIITNFDVAGSSIDITSRLMKENGDYSILTNASLQGDGWSAHVVIDPFMAAFGHMVEIRSYIDGCCVELCMPDIVCYDEVSFALSDIPGIGTILSNIPTPIPGLKGSVDAGLYLKVLKERTSSVVINEYELNPTGEDAGNEWVELYNPTEKAIDLNGWTLRTTHGIQAFGVMYGLLMPGKRIVYHFEGQALDNIGQGFPMEDSIVLIDNEGRRVDSTPFATDYWNDDRTWQRAKDGADRWEFRKGTMGSANGKDILSILDLNEIETAFVSAVTESLFLFSSGEPSMNTLADTLYSTLSNLVKRLAGDVLGKEVEAGIFVEVAATEATSTVKAGLRMELTVRMGSLSDIMDTITDLAISFTRSFGDPFKVGSFARSLQEDVWVGISAFGSIGLPRMVRIPGTDMEVSYRTSLSLNLAALGAVFGSRNDGWEVDIGTAICGIPGWAISGLGVPSGASVDIWLCKVRVQGSP